MRKYKLIVLLFFVVVGNMLAQSIDDQKVSSPWQSYFKVDLNSYLPNGSINSQIAVRQKVDAYSSGYGSNGSVWSDAYGLAAGLQWMVYNSNLRLGVSSGLRYTNYTAEIYGSVSTSADYFYLRYSEANQKTKFARVKSIIENKDYLSIPLEVSYKIFEYKRIALWTRLGGEFGLLGLSHKTDISFMDASMDAFETEVLPSFGVVDEKPLSIIYWTLGGSYRLKNGIYFRVDGIALSKYINTDAPFVLVESDYFTGIMLSMQIPISKR